MHPANLIVRVFAFVIVLGGMFVLDAAQGRKAWADGNWSCYANVGPCVDGRAQTLLEACQSFSVYHNNAPITDIYQYSPGSATWICETTILMTGTKRTDPTTPFCGSGEFRNPARASGCQKITDDYEEWGNGCTVGNPCNPSTGNKFETVTDYRSGGPDVFEFTRYYNSTSWITSGLGYGWRHTYSRKLAIDSGTAHLYRPDGKILLFAGLVGGLWLPHATSGSDTTTRLVQTASGWEVFLPDDTKETYDTDGNLLTIVKKNGYTQTIEHDAGGAVLVDNAGYAVWEEGVTGPATPYGNTSRWAGRRSPSSMRAARSSCIPTISGRRR